MAGVGAGLAGVVARLASRRTPVVVVPLGAGTEGSGGGSEPGGRTGQALGAVGAGGTPVVAGQTLLVHSVVVPADRTDAVLVDTVEYPLFGDVAGGAGHPRQAGVAGVVAPDAGHCGVVVVVALGAGAPPGAEDALRGVAGDALDGGGDAGQAGVGTGKTELVAAVVKVVVGAYALTGSVELAEGSGVAGRTGRGRGTGRTAVGAAGADPCDIEVLIFAGTPERSAQHSISGCAAGGALGGVGAGQALGEAGQTGPVYEVVIVAHHAVAQQGRPVVHSKISGTLASQASGVGVARKTAVEAGLTEQTLLKVVVHAPAGLGRYCSVQHPFESSVATRTGSGVHAGQTVVHARLAQLTRPVIVKQSLAETTGTR